MTQESVGYGWLFWRNRFNMSRYFLRIVEVEQATGEILETCLGYSLGRNFPWLLRSLELLARKKERKKMGTMRVPLVPTCSKCTLVYNIWASILLLGAEVCFFHEVVAPAQRIHLHPPVTISWPFNTTVSLSFFSTSLTAIKRICL